MRLPWIAVLAIACVTPAAGVSAQSIRGRVLDDSTEMPVSAAIVSLLDEEGNLLSATHTDSAGRFILEATEAGRYRLRAKANGYRDATTLPIAVADSGIDVRFVVDRDVVLLEAVEVSAASRPLIGMTLKGFEERRAKNQGFGVTRDDIEERHARAITDMLRMVPGVRIDWRFGGSVVTIPGIAARIRGECPVKVILDGTEFRWGSTTIDDIPTYDVEAIEVFRSLAEMPPELAGPEANCGVVAVWTRRGGSSVKR
jgi:Carboxypeptidase regulatory-like domain/TonB-dependent Receptor Plug Domain